MMTPRWRQSLHGLAVHGLAVHGLALLVLATTPSLRGQTPAPEIEAWITTADRSALFQRQPEKTAFGDKGGWGPVIVVDEQQRYQEMDGFGFALTGGSAELLMKMSPAQRSALLTELFATGGSSLGISYLRLSIGASDLNSFVFSYNDLPKGETDLPLARFSLAQDLKDVVPVMKEILAINPSIKVLGSPWSAPAWMKTNSDVKAGSLKPECYDVYARYFVKYIQAMKQQGISIDAITVQNEPLNANNTPSMRMLPAEHRDFVKLHLGPAFKAAGIRTKILVFDHNLDRIDYPLSILQDPEAAQYVDGSAFHHYGGDIGAMDLLHRARPDKHIYFTEQMIIEKPGQATIDIVSPVRRLIIGAPRAWSRNVLLWNLAADPNNDPHTDNGGCPMCQGAVTLDGDQVARNLAYYTVAHASKFVRPGSVRIASTDRSDPAILQTEDEERAGTLRVGLAQSSGVLPNVAFRTPEGRIVLIVANDSTSTRGFRIQHRGRLATLKLAPGAVGTFIW